MSDLFEKTIILDVADGFIQYANIPNVSKYQSVEIQIEWDTIDKTDGNVLIQESINAIDWDDVPTLGDDLDTASGSDSFQHRDFGGKHLRAAFDFGTAVSGAVYVSVMAKTR